MKFPVNGLLINICALSFEVPSQWVADYRQTLGKYSGFGLGQRSQIQDIYDVRVIIKFESEDGADGSLIVTKNIIRAL